MYHFKFWNITSFGLYNILWFVYDDLNPWCRCPMAIFEQIEALSKTSLILILSILPNYTIGIHLFLSWHMSCCFHGVLINVIITINITDSKSRIWMESGLANLKGKITFNHVVSTGIFWQNEIFNPCKDICTTRACQICKKIYHKNRKSDWFV